MTGAVLISVFFLLFTNYLVHELSKKELAEVQKIADAYKQLNDPNQKDYTDILRVIREASIPRIVVDENDNIIYNKNLDSLRSKDTAYLRSELGTMKFYNNPIRIQYGKDNKSHIDIYYKEQTAITLLRYFPYVQLMLIGLFLTISYVAFNTSRMYEQNKVWVGMAKETAHQIGTPLSSLMAWVEYLKVNPEPPGEEVLTELEKDIQRLEIITERFSKIGSTPELKEYNIYDVIHESIDYLRNRISNKVSLELTDDSDRDARAMLNKNLFSWVIENLSKNAVDAMPGKGEITYHIKQGRHNIYIDVKDTGKGVPRSNWKQIFKPGFTTKKRGWGLGLSLSKRIVENYHKGEIFIKESEPGKGTTFRIKLKRLE
jgi:signal transduction histidine kinase